jgi:2-acylglycerol O-acyltransferase 2
MSEGVRASARGNGASAPITAGTGAIMKLLRDRDEEAFKKPFKIGNIQFAPLDIPLARRLQTLCVLLWFLLPILAVIVSIVLLIFPLTTIPMLVYIGYCVFFQKFHQRGGMRNDFFRSLSFWKLFRDYFPISLVKSADIPADRPYIFGYHPHGIIAIGALTNFATEATGFSRLFPGINLRLLTLTMNFQIPFSSLVLGWLGACDASPKSINHILSKGQGNSVMLVLGGAKEALDARPGKYELFLKNRKGFVKLALRNGAALVPVFSFGELDVYDQVPNPEGSRLREVQDKSQEVLGFSLPLIRGRGIFNYTFGLLPHRRPIVSVVGRPIPVPKTPEKEITAELIDKYHEQYVAALIEVFDYHKKTYIKEGADTATLKIK